LNPKCSTAFLNGILLVFKSGSMSELYLAEKIILIADFCVEIKGLRVGSGKQLQSWIA